MFIKPNVTKESKHVWLKTKNLDHYKNFLTFFENRGLMVIALYNIDCINLIDQIIVMKTETFLGIKRLSNNLITES